MNDEIGKLCVHYKGGRYRIVGVATHSEDLSKLVIYQSEKTGELWARPYAMFFEKVSFEGREIERFSIVDEIF